MRIEGGGRPMRVRPSLWFCLAIVPQPAFLIWLTSPGPSFLSFFLPILPFSIFALCFQQKKWKKERHIKYIRIKSDKMERKNENGDERRIKERSRKTKNLPNRKKTKDKRKETRRRNNNLLNCLLVSSVFLYLSLSLFLLVSLFCSVLPLCLPFSLRSVLYGWGGGIDVRRRGELFGDEATCRF